MKNIMNLKGIVFILIFVFLCTGLNAQDTIRTESGKIWKCKITKITDKDIFFTYKKDNQNIETYFSLSQVDYYKLYFIEECKQADSSKIFRIKLYDGTVLTGNITGISDNSIVLETDAMGKITISALKVKEIEATESENFKNGEYWFPNPNATRYLFAPSAFNLKKGEGYYQNAYLIVNSANYGITDYFSIGGGFEFLTAFIEETSPILFLTPKVGFKLNNKFSVGAGTIAGIYPYYTRDENIPNSKVGGILYGVATYGNLDRNLSVGMGAGYMDNEIYDKPILTVNGMVRISPKVALVTENWFIFHEEIFGIITYGVRFFGEKIAVDLAFANNSDIFGFMFIGIPYVDFVVNF